MECQHTEKNRSIQEVPVVPELLGIHVGQADHAPQMSQEDQGGRSVMGLVVL